MCDPITLFLIGTAVSAGGNIISSNQAEENAAAMAAARNAQLADTLRRNDELAARSRALFQERADSYAPPVVRRNLEEAQDRRSQAMAGSQVEFDIADAPISGNAPKVVKSEIAKRMLDVFKQGEAQASASGRLGGYGDFFHQQGLDDTGANDKLDLLANRAQGNLNILPHLQDFAQIEAHEGPSTFGQILEGGGRLISSAAGAGFNPSSFFSPFSAPGVTSGRYF